MLPVDSTKLTKSINALINRYNKQLEEQDKKNILVSNDDSQLLLILHMKKLPINKSHLRSPLPIPLYLPKSNTLQKKICIFTKDPDSSYKSCVPSTITVLGIERLRKEYKPYEAQRRLLADYDMFLADKRILRMLPPLLGKNFFLKKKLPIPVTLPKEPSADTMMNVIDKAVSITPLYIPIKGRCVSIKIGSVDMSHEDLVSNFRTILSQAISKIPGGGLDNIQSVHLKTSDSIAFPLYSSVIE